MNISNFLHLYLPFQAMIVIDKSDEDTPTVIDVVKIDVWNQIVWDEDGISWRFNSIKPILRPLSDIREDEFKEVLYDEATEEFGGIDLMEQHKNAIENINAEDIAFTPFQTQYLLSKHFDIFGLIELDIAKHK